MAVATKNNLELVEFLKTEEAADLTDLEIAERFGEKKDVVFRARKRLAGPAPVNGHAEILAVPDIPAVPFSVLKISEIDLDAGTRVRSLDQAHVSRLIRVMEAAKGVAGFPPLEAWNVGGAKPALVKGFHRISAAERAFGPETEWTVVVKDGTLRDSILEAMRDNREHGLPLTDEARVGIIRRIFDDPAWGIKRASAWIARHVGETDRDLIERIRAEVLRERGQDDPGVREVQRGDQVYDQKVPRRAPKDDDRGEDAAQDDQMEVGGEEERGSATPADDETQSRIDLEYLDVIPCRRLIADSALPRFDLMALEYRDLEPVLGSGRRFLKAHKPEKGEWPTPLYSALERLVKMPVPIPADDQKGWVACSKCQDAYGKSTGQLDGGAVCGPCGGTGAKIPGLKF